MSFVTLMILYALVVFGALFGTIQWFKAKRRPKLPFQPDRAKLLRGPGESLRRKIELMDENQIYLLVGLLAIPLFAGVGAYYIMQKSQIGDPRLRAPAALLAGLVLIGLGSWYLAKDLIRRGNHYLGWFGERMTAEELEPLKIHGWRVFHDVPAAFGRKEFNIDHVLVGPGGIFSIETKMRRKGHARPDRKDYEVFYDGNELSWPWAEDRYGLDQAANNARWLEDWLQKMTGERLEVQPILVFPCWYVKPPNAVFPVSVVHTSYLHGFVSRQNNLLTTRQIDLIARQLDARCRDVVY